MIKITRYSKRMETIIILSICAILTSIISAVIGMGGGILLLSLMTFFLPLEILVPIHGVVQLVSNSSRVFYLRHSIRRSFLLFFGLGTPVGLYMAYKVLKNISFSKEYYLLLAIFIVYTVFKPKKMPEIRLKNFGWAILGSFAVIQGAFIGATGPLIAPFYIRSDLTKEEIIATKAAQQIFIHLLKIPLFLSIEFNYLNYSNLIISLCVCAIIGSYYGAQKALKKINENVFKKIFRTVLLLAAFRLLYKYFTL